MAEGGEVGIAELTSLCDREDIVGKTKAGKNLFEVLHVVFPAAAESGILVLVVHNDDAALEEAGEIGGPDEFFFTFALMVEGEDGGLWPRAIGGW